MANDNKTVIDALDFGSDEARNRRVQKFGDELSRCFTGDVEGVRFDPHKFPDAEKGIELLVKVTQQLLPGRGAADLQSWHDKLVDDLEIGDDEIDPLLKSIAGSVKQDITALCDRAEIVFNKSVRLLSQESDPWRENPTAASDYQNYMLRVQLVGLPRRKSDVAAIAREAAAGHDKGALRFWHENFEKIFDKANGSALGLGEREQIIAELDAARRKVMSHRQQTAADRLDKLRTAWAAENLDAILPICRWSATSEETKPLKNITRRSRTEQQRQVAADRKRIREAQARLQKSTRQEQQAR